MTTKNNTKIILIVTTILMISLGSCYPGTKYEKEEAAKINDYLLFNDNLNFELKESGLYYRDVIVGPGSQPVETDTVSVRYTVSYLDGTIVDTNVGVTEPYTYIIGYNSNIVGFNEGVSYMREGGKAQLLIPSSLAWGPVGNYPIPGYTPVIFDIELEQVKAGPGK